MLRRLRELELIDTYGCKLSPNVEAAVALDASEPWARWPEARRAPARGRPYTAGLTTRRPAVRGQLPGSSESQV